MGGRSDKESGAKNKIRSGNGTSNGNGDEDEDEDDPFDCSELVVPPSFRLVQNELLKHVKEWEELDSRIVNVTADETDGTKNETGNGTIHESDGSIHHNNSCSTENGNPNSNATIIGTQGEENEEEGQESTVVVPTGTGDYGGLNWGWHANRIRLPDYFDYACKRTEPPLPPPPPPPPDEKNTHKRKKPQLARRQVISLDDPTKFLDYEAELWKLFSDVPLANDLEEQLVQNTACKETFRVQREIEEGMKEYTRMDAHSLNRMRKRERHHWPRVAIVKGNETTGRWKKTDHKDGIHEQGLKDGLGDICGATIRVECWRRSLKRGSGCDSNKCEVELTESQTLLDLHKVLVKCSGDDLFSCGMKRRRHEKVAAEASRRSDGSEVGTGTDNTAASSINDDDDNDDEMNASGYFFIEDTFYINGDVDYVSPIIEWLDEEVPTKKNSAACTTTKGANKSALDDAEDDSVGRARDGPLASPADGATDAVVDGTKDRTREGAKKTKTRWKKITNESTTRSRREFLGIPRDANLKVISMSDVQLGDIRFRLACRYVHVFNGDCESAILFSDVSMRLSNENIPESQYPLVHDIFTTTTTLTVQEQAACQACERGPAVVMTLEDELTDGGPTLLCSICFAKLHYNVEGTELLYNNFQVVPLSVLQNLRDLSVGNDLTGMLF